MAGPGILLISLDTNGLEKTKDTWKCWKRSNDNVVWEYQDHKRDNFGFFLTLVI